MVIQGKAYYAKVLGKPAWGYKNQHKEWSMDVALSPETKKALTDAGVTKSVFKNKDDDRGWFLTFRRRELKKDGTPGTPIKVVDKKGNDWPQNSLIGNGSVVNVMVALNEYEGEIKPGLIKVQVVEHVPYEGKGDDEDFPTYNDDGTEEKWS